MTDHATLKSDIASYLGRGDMESTIPTLIRLCESKIRRDIKCRAMETTVDLTLSSQSVSLPSGFISAIRLYFDATTGRSLEYLTPEKFYDSVGFSETGNPTAFTIEGDSIIFLPAPSGSPTAKLLYMEAFGALSAESDTNWLLSNHYDVYLYGCLAEAKAFIEDDDQLQKWGGAYAQAKDDVNKDYRRSKRQGRLTRVGGVTP